MALRNASLPAVGGYEASASSLSVSARLMNSGVGCFGSPMDRLIGRRSARGTRSLRSAPSFWNGYGCRRARLGFMLSARARFGRKLRQLYERLRLPARLLVLRDNGGENPAAHVKLRGETHEARLGGGYEIAQDAIRHRFMVGALVAE